MTHLTCAARLPAATAAVTTSCIAAITALCAALATPLTAHAAHPLQSEDTGTQGAGNVEFENGFSRARTADVPGTTGGTPGGTTWGYQPQLSYGLLPTLDLILQPSWFKANSSDGSSDGSKVSGFGDTNLDAKWRFYGEAPWSLGVRAGITLATSQRGLGLPRGDVAPHATLVATYDAAPVTVHGNVSLTRNPAGSGQRTSVGRVSSAVMWAINEQLTLTVDAGAQADVDPARNTWAPTVLAGAIYTLQPGLDVDMGYQSTTRNAPAAQRQWLVGITYRFSP